MTSPADPPAGCLVVEPDGAGVLLTLDGPLRLSRDAALRHVRAVLAALLDPHAPGDPPCDD